MFENEIQTRCAICGTGRLLGGVLVLAHLPLILLIIPFGILFLGLVADPEETHAVWYGMLNMLGIFDLSTLTDAERLNYAEKRHYFWSGEVVMASCGRSCLPSRSGSSLRAAEMTLAFIGAAVLFLPLFVFLPKLIQRAMKADVDAAIEMFGKNEQVKKVFWMMFVSMAGVVVARVLDPETAQQVVGVITGMGG